MAEMTGRVPVEDKRSRARSKAPEGATEQFGSLREISVAVAGMRDLREILEKVADAALSAVETDVVVILLVDEARHTLVGAAGSTSLGSEGLGRLEETHGAILTELKFPLERGKALIVDTKTKNRWKVN